ncbi:LysR family transcriptional regulator [Oryzobacter sp. R7]|uniref:LysR family transcriptional regulator n=1 Tax=Oryzobacter faecalis TaxID=3388656 RepID=UPI00398D0C41
MHSTPISGTMSARAAHPGRPPASGVGPVRVEQVRAFAVLAEELNFRRAAARLFVSQPTLSAQIHGLERDLGVVLFERGREGTRLTDEAATVLPLARQALRALEDLESVAGRPEAGADRLSLGVAPDGIGPATWSAVRRLMGERPELDVALRPVGFGTMLTSLDDGTVDAVLLHGPVAERPGRVVVTVGEVRVGVLAPGSHPFATLEAVPLDLVAPHLRAEPPAGAGEEFTRFWLLRDHPSAPRPVDLGLGEDPATIAALAARKGVVALWPTDVVVPDGSGSVVVPLTDERWAPLQVVHRAHLPLGPALVEAARAAVAVTSRPGVVRVPLDGHR